MFNLILLVITCNNKGITFHLQINQSDKWHRWFGFQFSNVTKFDIGDFMVLSTVHCSYVDISKWHWSKWKCFSVWARHAVLIFSDWIMSSTYELTGRLVDETIFCRGLAVIWMLFCHSTLLEIQESFDEGQSACWIYKPLCKC